MSGDEISAIASNSYEIVGEVKYERIIQQVTNTSTAVVWKATVQLNVDDAEVRSWLNRDAQNRENIVNQNNTAQQASAANDQQVEDLRKRAQNATTDAERAEIRVAYEQSNNEFLANRLCEAGNQLAYRGDCNGAIAKYTEALQLNHSYWAAYTNRGLAYHYLQKYSEAIADHTKSIAINPHNVEPYINRGAAYLKMGNYTEAVTDFAKAIELNPNLSEAYTNRGIAYALTGNLQQAIINFTKAISLNPNDADNYQARGICYDAMGDTTRAQADFVKARALGYNG